MFPDLVLVVHLLSMVTVIGLSLALGLLPPALAAVLEPQERARVWAAIMTRARPTAMLALGLLFVTGFMNMANLAARPGLLLLLKILLAGGVAGHVFAQVRGVGQRLIDAASNGAESAEIVLRGERSLQRLAMSQAALAAIIFYISINL